MLQTIIHEFAHYVVAKLNNWQVISICIGDKDLSFNMGVLHFSFYPFDGSVEVKIKSNNKDIVKKLLFYSMGCIANIFVCIIVYAIVDDLLIKLVFVVITGITVFTSILPKPFKGDLFLFLKSIK